MTLRSVRFGACLVFLVTSLVAAQARAVVDVVQVVRDEADGLGGAWAVAVSPDGLDVYVASFYEDAVAMFRRDPATGEYRYRGKLVDGVGGIDGLDGAAAIAVSPDGYAVYVAGQNEAALAVFDRAPSTGSLAPRQVLRDDVGLIDGLATPTGIAVLADGSLAGRVYVSSYGDAALSVFDPSFEGLDFVAVYKNGSGGVTGLSGARAVVAANGDFGPQVYVASQFDAAVAVFATDFLFDFDEVQVLRDDQGGVDGLGLAQDVALSPDGNQLYVAGQGDDAVAVFLRNSSTGELTFNEAQKDGLFGVDGLDGAESVLMTPDGDHVYAAGSFEPAVAIFAFDAFDDGLDYLARVLQDPIPPFSLIHLNLAVLPDATQLLVTNSFEGTLSVFDRNFSSGALTLDATLHDGSGVRAMRGAQGVVASPDGKHVYAMGSEGSLISAFARDAASGVLSLLSTSGVYGEDPHAVAPPYRRAAMSPDGLFLYEARFRDDAIASYQRDAGTGALTASAGVTNAGVPDLVRPTDVVVSPDGTSLYAVGDLGADGSILAFARDPGTGAVTHLQTLSQGVDGVGGLVSPTAIALSPDGQFVYVASFSTEALAVFRRFFDGRLGFVTSYTDAQGLGDVFDGIHFATSIAISPDGLFVYVSGSSLELVWMQRSASTGELSAPQRVVTGAVGPGELAVDAAHLYLATYNDNGSVRHSALFGYDRDPTTGALTLIADRSDVTGTDSIDGAVSVALSPNGRSVYVAGYQDDAVTVFAPEPGAGLGTLVAIAALAQRSLRRRAARSASR